MKTMSATIQIGAPPEAVWAALTDLGRYPEWNPLFREASGQVAVGNRITLRSIHPANGRLMTVKPKITVADPGTELRWVSSLPGIISGEHRFALTPADPRRRRHPAGAKRDLPRPPDSLFRQNLRPSRGELPDTERGPQEAGRGQLTRSRRSAASEEPGQAGDERVAGQAPQPVRGGQPAEHLRRVRLQVLRQAEHRSLRDGHGAQLAGRSPPRPVTWS